MTPQQFINLLQKQQQQIEHAVRRTLPVKIGRKASDHVKQNFRRGGFQNRGLQTWKKTRRQLAGGKDAQYGPLMSRRELLARSIRYVPTDAAVSIGTSIPYAAIHNEGGTINTHPRITPKMRKFAWRKFFEAGGKKSTGKEAQKWKALALTKKQRLDIKATIPKRQFIGKSEELDREISSIIESTITDILKQ